MEDAEWYGCAIAVGPRLPYVATGLDNRHDKHEQNSAASLYVVKSPLISDLHPFDRFFFADLQVLAYFKVSITGTPSPQCRFTHWWLHLITKDPLLRHVAIYTASWFLWEQGAVARDVVEEHRGPLMLELELDPTVRYCYDVTVLAVAQMALNAWYWDDEGEPETHMNGLMEKLRWRGGLQTSGSHGFLSKMILVSVNIFLAFVRCEKKEESRLKRLTVANGGSVCRIDIAMALEGEREPWIYGRPGFDFEDDERPVLLRATYNSPLILDGPEFSVRADSWLGFYLATASVLDSLRALLRAVLDARAAGQSTTAIQRDAARMTGMLEARERESHAAASTASSKPTSPTQGGGPIDRTIRLAAMLHSRAIAARMPLSGVCSSAEAASLWAAFRSADMASWERLGGVCVWVLVVVAAAGGAGSGFQRTARMLLLPGLNAIAMEDWRAGMMAVGTALEIQEWLRDGDGSGGGGDDGE